MNVIKVGRKYTFDYKPEGLVFFGQTDVCILDRKSGNVRDVGMAHLEKTISKSNFKTIKQQLLMNNYYQDGSYEVVGTAWAK